MWTGRNLGDTAEEQKGIHPGYNAAPGTESNGSNSNLSSTLDGSGGGGGSGNGSVPSATDTSYSTATSIPPQPSIATAAGNYSLAGAAAAGVAPPAAGLLSPLQQVYYVLQQPAGKATDHLSAAAGQIMGQQLLQTTAMPAQAHPMTQTMNLQQVQAGNQIMSAGQVPQAMGVPPGVAAAAGIPPQFQLPTQMYPTVGTIPGIAAPSPYAHLGLAGQPAYANAAGPQQVLSYAFNPTAHAAASLVTNSNDSFLQQSQAQARIAAAIEMNNALPNPVGNTQFLQSQLQGVVAMGGHPAMSAAAYPGLAQQAGAAPGGGLQIDPTTSIAYMPMIVGQFPNSAGGVSVIPIGTQEDLSPPRPAKTQDDHDADHDNKKKKKRKRKEKAEGLPRRPLTAYNMYFRDEKNKIFAGIDAGMNPEELVKDPHASLQALVRKATAKLEREDQDGSQEEESESTTKVDDNGEKKESKSTTKESEDGKGESKEEKEESGSKTGDSATGESAETTTKNAEKGDSKEVTKEEKAFLDSQSKISSCLKSNDFMKSRVPGSKRMRALPHGKIAFAKLAKIVGARWKALDKETKNDYDKLAAEDMKRYRLEVKEFKEKNPN